MTHSPDDKDAAIARLLNELADLSGEQEALAAYRREAESFEFASAVAGVARALHALETEGRLP